jgi:hypothetical protein
VRERSQKNLLGLLQMYDTALSELEKMHDQGVAGLIHRMERHRVEVLSALEKYEPQARGPEVLRD